MAIFIGGPLDGQIVPAHALEMEYWDARTSDDGGDGDGFSASAAQYREKIVRYRRLVAARGRMKRTYFVAPDVADADAWTRACEHAGWEP